MYQLCIYVETLKSLLSIGARLALALGLRVLQTGTAQHIVNLSVASAYMLVSAFTMHVPRNI